MASRNVTVLGGTGFLGRQVVKRLLAHGFSVRVASRHPDRPAAAPRESEPRTEAVEADVNDDRSVAAAVEGAAGVVNAVSLYVEKGRQTFHGVHVEAAARVARLSRQAGVERLVHVSGIGSDPGSRSAYIRNRGEGEQAVRREFPDAVLIRPAVMFGPDDAFVSPVAGLLRRFPVFALFGRGRTKLQPVHVADVAEAMARTVDRHPSEAPYEFGGPHVYSYRSLVEAISRRLDGKPLLVPVPFGLWQFLAYAAEMLPEPPITRNQIELMRVDNVVSPGAPDLRLLNIDPTSLEEALPILLGDDRR